MNESIQSASGVQELIERIREEGVQSGRQQAEQILKEAKEKAGKMVADAKDEAQAILSKARNEIELESKAALEALKIAARDTSLKLGSDVKAIFVQHVKKLVSSNVQDKDFMKELILSLAGRTAEQIKDRAADVFIAKEFFNQAEEQSSVEGEERIRNLILGISSDMLREGIQIKPSESFQGGVRLQVKGEDLEVEFTDETISDFLLKHLIPRYRNILLGLD